MKEFLYLLIFLLSLNLLPIKDYIKEKYILFISFIILFLFIGLRYNYGIDYLTYERLFYSPGLYDRGVEKEPLFWWLASLFPKYYQFVLFQSLCICYTFYYMVKKYVPCRYYALFFLAFLCYPGMMFTIVPAMRNTFSALIVIWGIELFYLREYKPVYWLASIIVSGFFHNSSFFFIILPVIPFLIKKMKFSWWLGLCFVGLIISTTSITDFVSQGFSLLSSETTQIYRGYIGNRFSESSITVAVLHSFLLIPGFFAFKYVKIYKDFESVEYKITAIALFFITIYCFGIDFQQRISIAMFLYVIMSVVYVLNVCELSLTINRIVLFVFVFFVVWQCYIMFLQMHSLYMGMEGNFLYYQTIFDAPYLP